MNIKDLKVLIIDDISIVRTALKNDLKKIEMMNIFEAENIQDAWKILIDSNIDLVLSDWNMPGGDGIDLLKKIRDSTVDSIRFKKFIMITGATDKVLQAMDAGANNVVHKPFTSTILKRKIELIFHGQNI